MLKLNLERKEGLGVEEGEEGVLEREMRKEEGKKRRRKEGHFASS